MNRIARRHVPRVRGAEKTRSFAWGAPLGDRGIHAGFRRLTGSGQIDVPFWPGDANPFGGVVTTAAFYRFAGTTVNVVDFNAVPRIADFAWSRRITDIYAALS
jgi:hypothetical protein